MRRDVAEKIVAAAKRMDQIFDELDGLSHEIEDETERKSFRRATITLCFDLHQHITLAAVTYFPDLHPDKKEMQNGPKPSKEPNERD